MRVMKFGGTSVGDAARFRAASDLVINAVVETRVFVVVSAVSGVTNTLVEAAAKAAEDPAVEPMLARFRDVHERILADLAPDLGAHVDEARRGIAALVGELGDLLHGIALLRDASPRAQAHVCSLGERASVVLMGALLGARTGDCRVVDARDALLLTGDPMAGTPDEAAIRARLQAVIAAPSRLFVTGGFFGADRDRKTMLLGRGGSDWSGALVAAAVDAELLEIWTDVDGIFTTDPRVVPEATVLPEMSFAEAAELAYFGAKVLHPKTIAPARDRGIPVRVCNSFNPSASGTFVRGVATAPPHAVRGISFLDGVVMVDVSGAGLRGVPGVAARVFGACASREISVVLITQASSECSISFCIGAKDADRAVAALNDVFEVELAAGRVDPIALRRDLAVLSIVGDGMQQRPGVAGTLFGALADIGSNVVAIAQGSSERSISTVIEAREGRRAMAHVHHCFFDTAEVVELYVCGAGLVGSRLLDLVAGVRPGLLEKGVDLRVCGIANSKVMVVEPRGFGPGAAKAALAGGSSGSHESWARSVAERRPTHPVFVDCTSSDAVARSYPTLFDSGFHVVTANKKANAMETAFWRDLRVHASRRRRRFLYETNVGAGLPVIDTVKSLVQGGDRVLVFEGILSGTLSFLYGLLDAGVPFSEAVRTAKAKGFTEPDPRDDLSGADMARKVLILAREFGQVVEPSAVRVSGVLPADYDASGDVPTFLAHLDALDERFRAQSEQLRREGKVLRYVGRIDETGVSVGPLAVPVDHPLAAIKGGENALSFLTSHYSPNPMVIRGYGAGADVTAAGVLADILRIVVVGP